MSTLVLHGGEEVLYFIQLSATNEPMISKIERKSVAKKDFHIYLLCSVCLPRLLVGGSSQGGGYTLTAHFISFCLRRNKMSHKKGQTSRGCSSKNLEANKKWMFLPTRSYCCIGAQNTIPMAESFSYNHEYNVGLSPQARNTRIAP